MDSRNLKRMRALCRRYLDPNRSWRAQDDSALRQLVREDEACAAFYNRSVTIHRTMVGAEPTIPSAFERERMLMAQLDAHEPQRAPWMVFGVSRVWMPMALVAALALAVMYSTSKPGSQVGSGSFTQAPADADYLGARGGDSSVVSGFGLGLAGVTGLSAAYEVAQPGTALFFDDYLRISTSRSTEGYPYVFVFGLQPSRSPIWYEPDPEHGGTQSVSSHLGPAVPLGGEEEPFEFKVSGRHVLGPLRVLAVFSSAPLTHTEVKRALESQATGTADELAALSLAELESALSREGQAVKAAVADTSILSGSREGQK